MHNLGLETFWFMVSQKYQREQHADHLAISFLQFKYRYSPNTDNQVVLPTYKTLISSLDYDSGNNLIDMLRGIFPR